MYLVFVNGYSVPRESGKSNSQVNKVIKYHHHHHHHHHHHESCLTSAFSHLGWGWTDDDCRTHNSILCHMLLHSQQVHVLHHTITPLFPRPSCQPSSPNSHLPLPHPTHPLCPFHMSKPSQSSLPQLNRKVFNSTHLCHLTARPPILPPHSCHVQYLSIL